MTAFEAFLAKQKRKLDDQQLDAVKCDDNCVVSAGAGSGKTTVLSYRFLRLVLEKKANVNQILTLTFTRKAAREMQSRIHQHLLSCKDDPAIAAQLATFFQAPISTLDSFCSQIVRADCVRYGIPRDFSIDDEQNLRNLRRCAVQLLDAWPQSKGAGILCSLYSPDKLVDEVLIPLATTAYCLPNQVEGECVQRILDAVRSEYDALSAQFTYLLRMYIDLADDGTKTVSNIKACAQQVLQALDTSENDQQLLDLLVSEIGCFRKPGAGKSDSVAYIKETVDQLFKLRFKLCVALSVQLQSDRLEAVVDFFRSYVEACQKQKRQSGILTFSDVASLAVDILMTNRTLRRYYKHVFKYIMIDEFQDNNEQQKKLLYLLAERLDQEGDGVPAPENLEKGKLFFVGDEKQSIYRFRQADVSVFKRLAKELQSTGGRHLELATNYRSEPALIQWFNTLFPRIMAHDGEDFEADFSPLGTRIPTPEIKSTCTVLVKPYEKTDSSDDDEDAVSTDAEAFAVASLVFEMLNTDSYLIPSEQGPRRPKSDDIALLLRSTASQLSFEKAFRRLGIPYTVQAARSLMLEAPANDLYAVLQLLLYPDDKLAYATALRSPLCNLSDRALLSALDAGPFVMPQELNEENGLRLQAFFSFFGRFKEASKTKSLSGLVSMLWYESGYYLSLATRPSYQIYMEHYTFLHRLAQLQQQQGKSLSQFVDFLRQNLAKNEKIDNLEVIKEQEEGVQILSIHKSKGLEFPIVILANTGSKGKGDEDLISTYQGIKLPHYLDVPYHVSQSQAKTIRHAGQLMEKGLEGELDRAELKRLLYVALTRAETHIVISGCFNKNNRSLSEDGRASNLLLMLTEALGIDQNEPSYEDDFLSVSRIENIPEALLYEDRHEEPALFEKRMQEASKWYLQTVDQPDLSPIRYAVTGLHEMGFSEKAVPLPLLEVDRLLDERTIAMFGTYVHALLERLLQGQCVDGPQTLMDVQLASVGEQTVVADAMKLCTSFLQSTWYEREVKPYPVQCEVGFYAKVEHEGRLVVAQGSVDLLVDRGDYLLVVDFKTDRFRAESLHEFQVRTYMQAMQRIHQKQVRGCVVYLRDVDSIRMWEG